MPAAESETGKGIARYFATEEEAQGFIAEHHKSGSVQLAELSMHERQVLGLIQFTQVVPAEKKKAAKQFAVRAAKTVKEYVEKFRAGLPSSTLNSTKYSFNVFLVPKLFRNVAALPCEHVDLRSSHENSG